MRNLPSILMLLLATTGCRPGRDDETKKPLDDEAIQDLRRYIQHDVAAGFEPEAAIVTGVVELMSDEYEEDTLARNAATIARETMAVHEREQASWPAITDCDRLDTAFRELEGAGVVCRQHFTCCGSCGAAEIQDEMDDAARAGKRVRGYAFYHVQDTESAVLGDGLHLNYGALEDGEVSAIAIGQEVSAALRKQGLAVRWDGTWEKRIQVDLEWKRRR